MPGQGLATFIPSERSGGGDDPAGRLTVNSGVFNPELLGTLPGSKEWERGRLRDRIDATIAHEHEEARRTGITSRRLARARVRAADPGRVGSTFCGTCNRRSDYDDS